jgi:DNA-binding NarL/FixJ family response regulator
MNSENLKIIVVDDEDVYHRLLKVMLRKYDFDVVFCNNYYSLKELAKQSPKHIIIMDYNLGGESGADYIKKLNFERISDLNFIAISASENPKIKDEMIELGAKRFFLKDNELIKYLPEAILDLGRELGYISEK